VKYITKIITDDDDDERQQHERYTEENWTFTNWKEVINEESTQNYLNKSFEPESNNLSQEVARIFDDDEVQSDNEGEKRADMVEDNKKDEKDNDDVELLEFFQDVFKNLDSCRHDQKSDYDRISSQFSSFDEELRDIQREIEELEAICLKQKPCTFKRNRNGF
ncbi:6810_t:CDS:1, partial [Ambispora gerdemannii]